MCRAPGGGLDLWSGYSSTSSKLSRFKLHSLPLFIFVYTCDQVYKLSSSEVEYVIQMKVLVIFWPQIRLDRVPGVRTQTCRCWPRDNMLGDTWVRLRAGDAFLCILSPFQERGSTIYL